jgi:hypothetical protein
MIVLFLIVHKIRQETKYRLDLITNDNDDLNQNHVDNMLTFKGDVCFFFFFRKKEKNYIQHQKIKNRIKGELNF